MKIDRYGQAKILTPEEIQLLFTEGFTKERDRALFGICLYTAARVHEACSLRTADVYTRKSAPLDQLIIRKPNTNCYNSSNAETLSGNTFSFLRFILGTVSKAD